MRTERQLREIDQLTQVLDRRVDAALRLFIQAQRTIVTGDYVRAMQLVDQSLGFYVTGQALALKGSIYYLGGQVGMAYGYWEQALELVPDLVIPQMEERQQLQHQE